MEEFGGQLVFSTDYPHVDSRYPEAVEAFLQLPISDEAKRRILWDNCARFYQIETLRNGPRWPPRSGLGQASRLHVG